jgi:hypothetical protein
MKALSFMSAEKNIQEARKPKDEETFEKSKFQKAIQHRRKLPVRATKTIGPAIRTYIGL